jgi:hypothetical protein
MDRTKDVIAWIETLKKSVESKTRDDIPANRMTVGYDAGPKNIRVWVDCTNLVLGSKRVYCFIDRFGNILMAASWKTPAKGVRGTIDTVDASLLDDIPSWLYRRR